MTADKKKAASSKEKAPYSLYVDCPECAEETLHKVLKGKVYSGGTEVRVDATVKCSECGHVHVASVKESRPIEVPVVISWMGKSERKKIELDQDAVVSVDDVLQHEYPLLVTAVETKLRREKSARPADIVTIWAKRFDKVRVPFSVSRGFRVYSLHVEAVPEEEFCCGDVMEFDGGDAVITAIKTRERSLDRGCAEACDIVRVYCKMMRQSRR